MQVRRHEICDWNLVDVEEASPATAPEILPDAVMMMVVSHCDFLKRRG
jgi:hypothetical protein